VFDRGRYRASGVIGSSDKPQVILWIAIDQHHSRARHRKTKPEVPGSGSLAGSTFRRSNGNALTHSYTFLTE
jgi:hypothetical protein